MGHSQGGCRLGGKQAAIGGTRSEGSRAAAKRAAKTRPSYTEARRITCVSKAAGGR